MQLSDLSWKRQE